MIAAGPFSLVGDDSADHWLGEAWRAARDELLLFVRTLGAFLRQPRALMRAWVAGERRPMNPLGYLGMCLLLVAPAHFAISLRTRVLMDETASKMHVPGEVLGLVQAAEPYLGALTFAVIAHGILRLFGAKAPFARTLGAQLYAYGPMALATLLVLPYRYFVVYASTVHIDAHDRAYSLREIAAASVSFLVGITYTANALGGTHGVRRWKAVVAYVATPIVLVGVSLAVGWLARALMHARP